MSISTQGSEAILNNHHNNILLHKSRWTEKGGLAYHKIAAVNEKHDGQLGALVERSIPIQLE